MDVQAFRGEGYIARLAPRARRLAANSVTERPNRVGLTLPRHVPASAKSVGKPLFESYHFSPTLFSLSRSTHSGPGAVLGVMTMAFGRRRCPSRRELAVSAPSAKSVGNPYFTLPVFPPLVSISTAALSGLLGDVGLALGSSGVAHAARVGW